MALRPALALQPPAGRRAPSRGRVALVVLAVCVGALAVLGGLRAARAGVVLPGVQVEGVELGGLPEDRVAARLKAIDRSDEPITVAVDGERVRVTAAEFGYQLDREATAEAALRRGRQLNPLAALADQARAFWDTLAVAPRITVDDEALATRAQDVAETLSQEPVEGDLEFTGASVEPVEPTTGRVVAPEDVAEAVRPVLTGDAEPPVELDAEPVAPETTAEDAAAVASEAERALSAPVVLSRDDVVWRVEPAELASALEVERDGSDLSLAINPDTVADLAGDVADAVHREPVDATVRVVDGSPQVVPAEEGFAFDAERAAEQLLELATGDGERSGKLAGEVLEPDRTTAEAKDLEITEKVASFTTHFTAGQSRVQNIQRIAEIVDGALLEPGETLGLNDYVGPRTREKGFTAGGAIFDGEFVTDVGGGVSQFATTFYNAAYFGGYAIPEFKPHSYYISRYPVGREATIDYPHVELKVRNNSPHGLLVTTSSTDTSVTVSMWGTEWVEVDSIAGERRDVTPPPTERRETDELPEGQERVVQSGRTGFKVTVTRVLRFPDGTEERQPITTRYQAQPRIVEVGTGDTPDEGNEADDGSDGNQGTDGTDGDDGNDGSGADQSHDGSE